MMAPLVADSPLVQAPSSLEQLMAASQPASRTQMLDPANTTRIATVTHGRAQTYSGSSSKTRL